MVAVYLTACREVVVLISNFKAFPLVEQEVLSPLVLTPPVHKGETHNKDNTWKEDKIIEAANK